MTFQIIKDACDYPELFVWNGALREDKINEWVPPNGFHIPLELKKLWIATGGGDVFESETILSPFATDSDCGLIATNEFYWSSGFDNSLLVFHVGTWISAIRNEGPHVFLACLNNGGTRLEFDSLDSWYCHTIRSEYALRYGLRSKPTIGF